MVDNGAPPEEPRRKGSPHPQVNEAYRAQMIAAATELVREHGYRGLDVDAVSARARVSRRTFYDLLGSREGCFVAVLEATVARVAVVMTDAFAGAEPGGWQIGVRAALETVLAFIEEEPGLGSALVVDSLATGPNVLAYRARVLDALVVALDEGPTHSPDHPRAGDGGTPLPLTGELLVSGILGILHFRLAVAEPAKVAGLLEGLTSQLVALAVEPYMGRAAAEDELNRPVGEVKRRWDPPEAPLPNLGMRITYRRLRVLSAIAEIPGASSRNIADRAGIKSAGQISKLLARLEELGLIENTAEGPRSGGRPKAWRLTELGEGVWRALYGRDGEARLRVAIDRGASDVGD